MESAPAPPTRVPPPTQVAEPTPAQAQAQAQAQLRLRRAREAAQQRKAEKGMTKKEKADRLKTLTYVQTDHLITLTLPVRPGVGQTDLAVTLTKGGIEVFDTKNFVTPLDRRLFLPIDPGACSWEVVGSGNTRAVQMVLRKKRAGQWEKPFSP